MDAQDSNYKIGVGNPNYHLDKHGYGDLSTLDNQATNQNIRNKFENIKDKQAPKLPEIFTPDFSQKHIEVLDYKIGDYQGLETLEAQAEAGLQKKMVDTQIDCSVANYTDSKSYLEQLMSNLSQKEKDKVIKGFVNNEQNSFPNKLYKMMEQRTIAVEEKKQSQQVQAQTPPSPIYQSYPRPQEQIQRTPLPSFVSAVPEPPISQGVPDAPPPPLDLPQVETKYVPRQKKMKTKEEIEREEKQRKEEKIKTEHADALRQAIERRRKKVEVEPEEDFEEDTKPKTQEEFMKLRQEAFSDQKSYNGKNYINENVGQSGARTNVSYRGEKYQSPTLNYKLRGGKENTIKLLYGIRDFVLEKMVAGEFNKKTIDKDVEAFVSSYRPKKSSTKGSGIDDKRKLKIMKAHITQLGNTNPKLLKEYKKLKNKN